MGPGKYGVAPAYGSGLVKAGGRLPPVSGLIVLVTPLVAIARDRR